MLMVALPNLGSAQVLKKTKYFNYQLNVGINHTNLLNYYENFELSSIEEYMKSNRDGLSFHSEAQLFYLNRIGLGLRYDYFANTGNKGIINLAEPNNPIYANYKHSIFLHTISPSLLVKTPIIDDKLDILFRIGLDINDYRSPYTVDTDEFEMLANQNGYHVGLSTILEISKHFELGINTLYRAALLNNAELYKNGQVSTIDLSGNDRINLNRISIGVSLGMK